MGNAGLATAHALAGTLLAANHLVILWTTLPVVGAILLGALAIAYARRWRDRPKSVSLNTSDQLAHFRLLYERGQLSAEEYARVQALLNERLRKELDLPAPAPALPDAKPVPAGSPLPSPEDRTVPWPHTPTPEGFGPALGESNGHPRPKPGKDTPPNS
jgi:hypothetical protein